MQSTWDGDIASLRPLGDFVLVKPIQSAAASSIIIDPKTQMTKDGRWRLQNRETGNQFGMVIAVGAGDKKAETASRHDMNVQVGDTVIFPRVPANEIVLNGEVYCWLREEQHVLAVVSDLDERSAA